MARRKNPIEKARLTGALQKHPERYKDVSTPKGLDKVGDPPEWLTEAQKESWAIFVDELPWLVASDRALLESACILRSGVLSGADLTAAHIRELRMHLTAMGATPTSRHGIHFTEDDEDNDPFAKFARAH